MFLFYLPTKLFGNIISDLKHAVRHEGIDTEGHFTKIIAKVPLAGNDDSFIFSSLYYTGPR